MCGGRQLCPWIEAELEAESPINSRLASEAGVRIRVVGRPARVYGMGSRLGQVPVLKQDITVTK
jgi:hypothetical protein